MTSRRLTAVLQADLLIGEGAGDPRDADAELAALAARAAAGDAGSERAFETLAQRVYARVQRWAARFTGDADDAEDVAQLVLLRLHEHVRSFEGRSRFTSWLYRVTHNLALDRRRLESRRLALLAQSGLAARTHALTPAEDATSAAQLARIARAFASELTSRQREVFQLADLEGRSSVEIAKSLGIEPVTVRVLLCKARRTIRLRMLAEHAALLEDYEP